MIRLRITCGAIVVALVAALASPCFALGQDAHGAMACCAMMGHSDCKEPRLAQACCQAGSASSHDRELQSTVRVTPALGLMDLSIYAIPETPSQAPWTLTIDRLQRDRPPDRLCPLLI